MALSGKISFFCCWDIQPMWYSGIQPNEKKVEAWS